VKNLLEEQSKEFTDLPDFIPLLIRSFKKKVLHLHGVRR